MIGVDPLRPGIGSFQAMFSVVLHLSGRPFSVLMPFIAGPRHCGQFSADSVAAVATATIPVPTTRFIRLTLRRHTRLRRDVYFLSMPGDCHCTT